MKSCITLLLLFFSANCLFAQQQLDTIFYDKSWKEINYHYGACYYRILKQDSTVYNVGDYYINGKPQMTGYFSSLKPETREGKFIWYSAEGTVTEEKIYQNNKLNGEYKAYYPDGKLK